MRPPRKLCRRCWPAPTQLTTKRRSAEQKRCEVGGPGRALEATRDAKMAVALDARAPADDAAGRRAVLRYYDRAVFGFAAALAGGAIPAASVESVVAAMVQYADRALQVRLALPAPAVARDALRRRRAARGVPADGGPLATFSLLGARGRAARAEAAAAPHARARFVCASDAADAFVAYLKFLEGRGQAPPGRRRQGGDGCHGGDGEEQGGGGGAPSAG